MFKLIAKWLCPSSAAIAETVANKIQGGYNEVALNKREVIAKYAAKANEIGEYGRVLSQMFCDGRIDDDERNKIAAVLETLIEQAKGLVFE